MIRKPVVMICTLVLYGAMQQLLAAQTTQPAGQSSSPTSNTQTSSGEKSVVGCVVKEGNDFFLKADDGVYQFNTERDLTPYVGKKVRISGKWQATGVTTTAPMKASGGNEAATPASASNAPTSISGDLHLHITGEVVGDCAAPK